MKHCVPIIIVIALGAIGVTERQVYAQEGSSDPRLAEVDERIRRGESLFGAGDFDGALVEFQRAYELLEGHPMQYLALYNMGQCQERLFQYGQAMQSYRRYLELAGPEVEGRAQVQATINTLTGLLATIRLTVNVSGYEVWVDEQSIGSDLTELLVPGGSHVIEIRAPGYVEARQQVTVPARTEQSIAFELEALAEGFAGLNQAYFWASAGLAVVTVAVGAVVGGLAMGESSDVETRLANEREAWNVSQNDLDHIDTLALTADILYGTAGLFAITAIVLAFFTNWGNDEEEQPGEMPQARGRGITAISLGFGSFGLEGRF